MFSITHLLPPIDAEERAANQLEFNAATDWFTERMPDVLSLPIFGLTPNDQPEIKRLAWSDPLMLYGTLIGFADLTVAYTGSGPTTVQRAAMFVFAFDITYAADLVRRLRMYDIAAAANTLAPLMVVVTIGPDPDDRKNLQAQGFAVIDLGELSTLQNYDSPISELIDAHAPAPFTRPDLAALVQSLVQGNDVNGFGVDGFDDEGD